MKKYRFVIPLLLLIWSPVVQAQSNQDIIYQGIANSQIEHVLETQQGNFLLSGIAGGQACVIMIDASGKVIWSNTVLPLIDRVVAAVEMNNSYIIAGNQNNFGTIYRLNKLSGNVISSISTFNCIGKASRSVPCEFQFAKNALIRDGNGFIIGGRGGFSADGVIERYFENLVEDNQFNTRINQIKNASNSWPLRVKDIERAPNGDLLFLGEIRTSSSGCTVNGVDQDIWILRLDPNLIVQRQSTIGSDAFEEFIDATVTPDDKIVLSGSSTATQGLPCSSYGPENISAGNIKSWIWKINSNHTTEHVRNRTYNNDLLQISFLRPSLTYKNGVIIGGYYIDDNETSIGLVAVYDDELNESCINTFNNSIFQDVIYSNSEAKNIAGGYSFGNLTRKILVGFQPCVESNDLCQDAAFAYCGEYYDGSTDTSTNRNEIYYCQGDSFDDFVQPDVAYQIIGNVNFPVFIGMRELTTNSGLDFFVVKNCFLGLNNPENEGCIEFIERSSSDPPATAVIDPFQTDTPYNAIIDSKNQTGDFRLSLSCLGDCDNYPELVCEQPIQSFLHSQESSSICAYQTSGNKNVLYDQYSGFEYRTKFIARETGSYTFVLSGMQSNLDLLLLGECNPFECLDVSINNNLNEEFITVNLDAGQTVFPVIDAMGGTANSPFTLSVECCKDISCGCENPIDISCGEYREGNNRNGQMKVSSYSCFSENYSGFTGPELIYRIPGSDIDTSKGRDLFIGFEEYNGNQGLDIFVVANCNNMIDGESTISCLYGIERDGTANEDSYQTIHVPDVNPGVDYFVIVDSKGITSDFRISISCPEDCVNDTPLQCNEPRFANNLTNGSTKICAYYLPATDEYYGTYNGSDYKVPFVAPRDGEYLVQLSDLSANLDLFVLSMCNPFQCIGRSNLPGTNDEEVMLSLSLGDTIYVIVDAFGFDMSSFQLNIECCEAGGSMVSFPGGNVDTLICLEEGIPANLEISHDYIGEAQYQFILTDQSDVIISLFNSPLRVMDLDRGVYRIYGVSYLDRLFARPGSLITNLESDICHFLSQNFLTLTIDRTYQQMIDTTICAGQSLLVCDTIISSPGEYMIRCQTKYGCDSIFNIMLFIDNPEVEITGPLTLCPGNSNLLEATPGYPVYLWSNENVDQTISVTQPGSYSVTVTTDNQCLASDTVQVVALIELNPSLGPDTTLCSNQTMLLDPGIFSEYLWSTGETSPTIEVQTDGEYSVTVSSGSGCMGTDFISVRFQEAPLADAGGDQVSCFGREIDLTGSGGMNCSWSDIDGNILSNNCRLMMVAEQSTPLVFETSLTYLLQNDQLLTCNSADTISVTIFEQNGGIKLIEDTLICPGISIKLTQSIECNDCDCIWSSTSTIANPTSCSPTVTPSESTTYVVTAITPQGCEASDTAVVNVLPSASVVAVNDHFDIRKQNTAFIPFSDIIENDTVPDTFLLIADTNAVTDRRLKVIQVNDNQELEVQSKGSFEGLFSFGYTVTDSVCGNSDTATIEIFVFETDKISICDPTLGPCNIMEGIENYPNNKIIIVDREGNIVHAASPYLNDWDGINADAGTPVVTGAYYFVLHLGESIKEKEFPTTQIPIRGVITIVRQ